MTLINIAFVMINLMILAINFKLYTEILKDKSQDLRAMAKGDKL